MRTDRVLGDVFVLSLVLVLLSIPFLYGYHTADLSEWPRADCIEAGSHIENIEELCPKKPVYQRIDHGLFTAAVGGGIGVAVFGFGMVLAALFTRYLIPVEADKR